MADNPRAAFRSVSALVLAVFVGTFFAGAVPAALAAQQTPTDFGSAVPVSRILTPVGDTHHVALPGGSTT